MAPRVWRLVDPLDDECHVVAARRADQRVDQPIGDILDGFIADGHGDVGEATETLFEILVASFDEAVGVEDEQVVRGARRVVLLAASGSSTASGVASA